MSISDAEHNRALATILGADGLYLADEVRDEAAVLASHLIERFEAAYQVAAAYIAARNLLNWVFERFGNFVSQLVL